MPLGAAQKARIDETMGSEVSKRSGENFHSTGFAYHFAPFQERALLEFRECLPTFAGATRFGT